MVRFGRTAPPRARPARPAGPRWTGLGQPGRPRWSADRPNCWPPARVSTRPRRPGHHGRPGLALRGHRHSNRVWVEAAAPAGAPVGRDVAPTPRVVTRRSRRRPGRSVVLDRRAHAGGVVVIEDGFGAVVAGEHVRGAPAPERRGDVIPGSRSVHQPTRSAVLEGPAPAVGAGRSSAGHTVRRARSPGWRWPGRRPGPCTT